MTQIDVKFPEDALNDIVHKAILEQVTAEQRDAIIGAAVKALTERPKSTGYGSHQPQSALQDAFNMAVQRVANRVAVEVIDNDPVIQGKIRALMGEAVAAAMDDEYSLKFAAANAMGSVLLDWKRDQ